MTEIDELFNSIPNDNYAEKKEQWEKIQPENSRFVSKYISGNNGLQQCDNRQISSDELILKYS